MTATRRDWAFLLTLGIIWGGSFPAISFALEGFAPFTISTIRVVFAALFLVVYALFKGVGLPPLPGKGQGTLIWSCCLGMGIFSNALPFSLLAWGQTQVTSAFAGISMAATPLGTMVLVHFLLKGDPLTSRRIIGIGLGFIGTVILIGPDAVLEDSSSLLPRLACVGAAMCYAIGSIITRVCPSVPMVSFSAAALLCGAVVMIPIHLATLGLPQFDGPVSSVVALGYLALIPTALATLLLVEVIRSAGPAFMSQVNYQVPVWASLFGVILLGDTLPVSFIAALALILGGLAISQPRPKSAKASP